LISVHDVLRLVSGFPCGNDGEAVKSRDLVIALLEHSPEPFSRMMFTPGHITCTGAVISPNRRKVLLVHHGRLNRWLLPGGHVEPIDATISDVARREVAEETGAVLWDQVPILVGIDVHPIPPRREEPLHLHHDLIFGFRAVSEMTTCSEESRAVVWASVEEFDAYELPGSIRRAVARTLNLQSH
jgi:8-oxo-dGTP pyrophosphatase MutT (NUDIX family)